VQRHGQPLGGAKRRAQRTDDARAPPRLVEQTRAASQRALLSWAEGDEGHVAGGGARGAEPLKIVQLENLYDPAEAAAAAAGGGGGGGDFFRELEEDLVPEVERCCGALHCRACISKCATCPLCRKPVSADTIIPDVRCERVSAAAIRPCSYAEEGCVFKANRASVAAHEELCDYVPRSVLREKIQKLENDMREQSLAHMTERFRLMEENSSIYELTKTQKNQK
jgi:hypothetical protein